MDDPRLYIATRDPRGLGGVANMARFVYETAAEAGYDPCLVCNVLDREYDVRITDVLTLDVRREIEHTTVEGMELKGLPRILPELEFLQYVLNRRFWRQALADGDVFFGVGGSNHCCLPLCREGVSFGSWTATPFWEDRADRLATASLPRRIRDRASRPVMEWLEGRIYRCTDRILVLSEYTASTIAQRHGIDRDRIEVVPYPIDTEQFSPEGPAKPDDDRPTILFVGRFNDARKNTPMLLEAVDRVREDVPDVRLLLIGDEPDESLRARIAELDLGDSVECIDYVDNDALPAYYRGADVFAIPSRQEGLAIVGLEAMACGTPVVSTRCGGPEEYVVDGDNGFLVPRDDEYALSQMMMKVLSNPDRDGFGDPARTMIVNDFAATTVGTVFVNAIESLPSNPSTGQ